MKEVLSDLTMPSGVPIKKVRVLKAEKTIRPLRKKGSPDQAFVKPGSTHHLCIFEWEEKGKTKRDAVFVTMLEATERLKKQKQLLSVERKQWTDKGVTGKRQLKKKLQEPTARIVREHPVIQRDATKIDPKLRGDIPANAKFVMSLSRGEMVLAEIDGEEALLVMQTSIQTEKKMEFAPPRPMREKRRKSEKLT